LREVKFLKIEALSKHDSDKVNLLIVTESGENFLISNNEIGVRFYLSIIQKGEM